MHSQNTAKTKKSIIKLCCYTSSVTQWKYQFSYQQFKQALSKLILENIPIVHESKTKLFDTHTWGSTSLQQRYNRTVTLQLNRNCYILCVRGNLKVVLSFNYCLIFFKPKPSLRRSFFSLQLLFNCIFKTVAVMSVNLSMIALQKLKHRYRFIDFKNFQRCSQLTWRCNTFRIIACTY